MIEQTSNTFPWLSAIILFPALASLAIPILPSTTVRWYALGVGLTDFLLSLWAFCTHYDLQNSGFQLAESYAWMPQIGLNWSVAVDGLSMPLIVLTGLINTQVK
jgi:NAD(P)H-quinone oxidoreductase subunit 4